jgi:hypothetical protein
VNVPTAKNTASLVIIVGFLIAVWGLVAFSLARSGICESGPNGTLGCSSDYTPAILPSIIGGALIVGGAWTLWIIGPSDRSQRHST